MTGKEHWRTEKRRDVSEYGKGVISKINAYQEVWRNRCYFDDIPDEVPNELMRSGLAPSWKAIAIAILLNRYSLLGIYPKGSIFFAKPKVENSQINLSLQEAAMKKRKDTGLAARKQALYSRLIAGGALDAQSLSKSYDVPLAEVESLLRSIDYVKK